MKILKMFWNNNGGKLVCRWVESTESDEPDAVSKRLIRAALSDGTRNLSSLITAPYWQSGRAA